MDRSFVLTGAGLSVAFERRGDRFEHVIGVLGESSAPTCADPTPLLASQPGGADDPWPASPPFTGLHRERRGSRQFVFLVGQAGDSHWSASVELDEGTGLLAFDVACRARSRPTFLGSTYLLHRPAVEKLANGGLQWAAPTARLEIDPAASPAELLRETAGTVAIVPVMPPATAFPATIRWRYVVRRVS